VFRDNLFSIVLIKPQR